MPGGTRVVAVGQPEPEQRPAQPRVAVQRIATGRRVVEHVPASDLLAEDRSQRLGPGATSPADAGLDLREREPAPRLRAECPCGSKVKGLETEGGGASGIESTAGKW
jgi:hypothetical protein